MKARYLARAAALASASPAAAQSVASLIGQNFGLAYNRGGNVSVLDRARPDYDPIGVPVGTFRLYPSLNTQLEYVDNIYASQNGRASDGIFPITPWSRNAFSISGDVSRNEYFTFSNNDTTNYGVRLNGRLDLLREDSVVVGYDHEFATEPRTNSIVAQESPNPSQFTHDGASVSGVHQLDRIRLVASFTFNHLDYQDLTGFNDIFIPNEERSYNEYQAVGRADYAISPDFAIFGSVEYNKFDYKLDPTDRNSDGYIVLGGVNMDIPNLIRGEVGVGYLTQDYNRGADQSGIAAQAQLQYFPTQLTTVTLNAQRRIENASVINSGGDVLSTVSLRVDHELRRNVLLFAQLGYSHDDFQGFSFTDNRYSAGFGATYLVNRLISLNAAFDHETQSTTGSASPLVVGQPVTTTSSNLTFPYDINSVYIGLTLHR